MSRLLTGNDRRNDRVIPRYRDWITSDMVGVDASASDAVVTAHATIHTVGSYTELITATAAPVTALRVKFRGVAGSGNATSMLANIATGAAASEVVLIPNINIGYTEPTAGSTFLFPVSIPAGTRISANIQALITVDTTFVTMRTLSGSNRTATSITDLGTNTAASNGVSVATGTSSAEGSWTEIISSTANHYGAIMAAIGGAADISVQTSAVSLDIGVGAAASEVAIVNDISFVSSSNEEVFPRFPIEPIYHADIPAGSRLSARISSTSATAQNYDVILYGLM
jgi:hypothetical protein